MANLFTQTGFEVNASSMESNNGFNSIISASFARVTTMAHSGSASLQITWPAPDGSKPSWVNHAQVTGLTVGRMYHVSCWAYVPTGSPDMRTEALFVDAGPTMSTKDAWSEITWDFVATSDAHHFGWATVGPPVGGALAYIDDLSLDFLLNDGTLDADTPSPITLDQQLVRGSWKSPLELPLITADLTGHMAHTRRILTPSGWHYMNRVKWPTP